MEHMRNVVITSKEHFLLLISSLLFFDVNTEKSNAKRDDDSPLRSHHELFRCSESGWLRMKNGFPSRQRRVSRNDKYLAGGERASAFVALYQRDAAGETIADVQQGAENLPDRNSQRSSHRLCGVKSVTTRTDLFPRSLRDVHCE